MTGYNQEFYDDQMQGSLRSAEIVVPIVMDILQPDSVIDVGCGVGTWLSVYKKHGVKTILGLDGDYVEEKNLKIDRSDFQAADLSTQLEIERTFDLVQSLEVAEHLEKSNANDFVNKLVGLGQAVLFSAAVPYQLGTNHVNEQLLPYWIELFAKHNYQVIDCVRPDIWNNEQVEVCYRQNIVLFASAERIQNDAKLGSAYEKTNKKMHSVIHPELYMPRIDRLITTSYEAAQQLHKMGNLQAAEGLYRSLLIFNPHAGEIWCSHGQLAAQAGDLKIALASLNKAVESQPDVASHYYNLGHVYLMMNNKESAKEKFKEALELKEDYELAKKALSALPSN